MIYFSQSSMIQEFQEYQNLFVEINLKDGNCNTCLQDIALNANKMVSLYQEAKCSFKGVIMSMVLVTEKIASFFSLSSASLLEEYGLCNLEEVKMENSELISKMVETLEAIPVSEFDSALNALDKMISSEKDFGKLAERGAHFHEIEESLSELLETIRKGKSIIEKENPEFIERIKKVEEQIEALRTRASKSANQADLAFIKFTELYTVHVSLKGLSYEERIMKAKETIGYVEKGVVGLQQIVERGNDSKTINAACKMRDFLRRRDSYFKIRPRVFANLPDFKKEIDRLDSNLTTSNGEQPKIFQTVSNKLKEGNEMLENNVFGEERDRIISDLSSLEFQILMGESFERDEELLNLICEIRSHLQSMTPFPEHI